MPNRDGSGPAGEGPMTGRGIGNCAPGATPDTPAFGRGRWFGRRFGRRGGGRGRGWGMGLRGGQGLGRVGLGQGSPRRNQPNDEE